MRAESMVTTNHEKLVNPIVVRKIL